MAYWHRDRDPRPDDFWERRGTFGGDYARDEHRGGFADDYTRDTHREGLGDDYARDPRFQSFRGRGPKGYRRSDDRIREEVNERLTDDHDVDASGIEVTVTDCEVTLLGKVSNRRQKRLAEQIAESCRDVRDVHNRLTVAPDAEMHLGKASE